MTAALTQSNCGRHGGNCVCQQKAECVFEGRLPSQPGTESLPERLRAACDGHPHAKIEWPHRILHEAADRIEELTKALEWRLIADFVPDDANSNVLVVDSGVVSEAYYDGESDSWWLANTSEHDFDAASAIYPTHWRPMYAPPALPLERSGGAT